MVSRADSIGQLYYKADTYSDFSNAFTKHPITRELITLKNEDSVKQAVKNLIMTSVGERLFEPFFGSDVNRSLFENFGPFTAEDLVKHINKSVRLYEPRVDQMVVTPLEDPDRNGIAINILFTLINKPDPVQLSIFLKRVR
jgi:phage baseplate assembly protein W